MDIVKALEISIGVVFLGKSTGKPRRNIGNPEEIPLKMLDKDSRFIYVFDGKEHWFAVKMFPSQGLIIGIVVALQKM